MKSRHLSYVVLAALVVAIFVALRSPAQAEEPPATTSTEPTPNPLEAKVDELGRQLQATQQARRKDRYRYRRALQVLIHRPTFNHPLERAFLCIHSGEGRWTDPNPPYWGGLQMDRSFMAAYMPWAYRYFGTADRWPVSVQLAAGIHAVIAGRGFYPWPNTARVCGLIR